MAFFKSPNETTVPAYRPVAWAYEVETTSDVENIVAEVWIEGAKVAEFRKSYLTKTDSSPPAGENNYYFEIDAQSIIQNYFKLAAGAIRDIFIDLGEALNAAADDSRAEVYLKATPEFRNSDNYLELGVTTSTSSTVTAINGGKDHNETPDYIGYIYEGAALLKFLTRAPATQYIGLGESHNLCFLSKDCDVVRVITNTTVLSQTGLFDISNPVLADRYLWALGAGPANLDGLSWDYGNAPFSDATLTYSVEVGTGDTGLGTFTPYSEAITFTIRACVPQNVRIHWLNDLGGADAFTFTGSIKKTQQVEAVRARRPLKWRLSETSDPHTKVYDTGLVRSSIADGVAYSVEQRLNQADGDFLRSLYSSPEVYLETDDGYLPAIIEDVEIEYYDGQNWDVKHEFTLILPDRIRQRG